MVIKKNLEAGHVLWVRKIADSQTYVTGRRAPDGSWERIECQTYQYLILTTRRGRTQGATVEKDLCPFLKALGIKLIERPQYNGGSRYTAVGTVWRTRNVPINDEIDVAVSDVAMLHYGKLKNIDIKPLLDKRSTPISPEIILEMRHVLTEPIGDIWPAREPSFPIRDMSISSYVQNVRW